MDSLFPMPVWDDDDPLGDTDVPADAGDLADFQALLTQSCEVRDLDAAMTKGARHEGGGAPDWGDVTVTYGTSSF